MVKDKHPFFLKLNSTDPVMFKDDIAINEESW